MTLDDFCASYLKAQGIEILAPCPRERTSVVGKREGEFVPTIPQYERGDLS